MKIGEYLLNEWRPNNNMFAVSRNTFKEIIPKMKEWGDKVAYISIENTKECNDFYEDKLPEEERMGNDHLLEDSENVLNINFDDVRENVNCYGYEMKCISREQAKDIVNFVRENIDKSIIVHCRAGVSRSQAVVYAIKKCFKYDFNECYANELNPCLIPNDKVVTEIEDAYLSIKMKDIFSKEKMYI